MKKNLVGLIIFVVLLGGCRERSTAELAKENAVDASEVAPISSSELTLELNLDSGIIRGYVRNNGDMPVTADAERLYGWWEFTQVFYFDGAWHEAPLTDAPRAHLGKAPDPVKVELKPSEVLVSRRPYLHLNGQKQVTPYTFGIDLSDHILPRDLGGITKIRIKTLELEATLDIKAPNKELKAMHDPVAQLTRCLSERETLCETDPKRSHCV